MFKDFWTILQNNWWVLLTIFVISLFIKDGGIFFVTWNASSWGVILSYRAITSAGYVGGNAFTFFAIIFMLSGPFLILEGLAYILAAISGNIISKDVVKKTKNVKVFLFYALCGVTLSFIMHLLLNRIQAPVWASILLQMLIICIILGLLSLSFKEKKMKEVFIYNIFLLFIAIGLFIIGALLEALITQNVPVLTAIYSTSSLFIAAVS